MSGGESAPASLRFNPYLYGGLPGIAVLLSTPPLS